MSLASQISATAAIIACLVGLADCTKNLPVKPQLTLYEAMASGKVTAVYSLHTSAEELIEIKLTKGKAAGEQELEIDLPSGTMIGSADRAMPTMVVGTVRGEYLKEETRHLPSHPLEIRTETITWVRPKENMSIWGEWAIYYVTAYSVELSKGRPKKTTPVVVRPADPMFTCLAQTQSVSPSAIQAAIWMHTDKITYQSMNKIWHVVGTDWAAGERLLRHCEQRLRAGPSRPLDQ